MTHRHGKPVAVPQNCFCRTTILGIEVWALVLRAYRGGQVTIYPCNNMSSWLPKRLQHLCTIHYEVRIMPCDIIGFINSPFT